jgi:membrane associated rhomboid family serine protease
MNRGRTLSLSFPPFTKAVKWLLLINAGMFLLQTLLKVVVPTFGDTFSRVLSLIPWAVVHGWIFQLVTYAFLHAGIWHIVFNMLWLWWFGATLEMDWGPKRFLEFYLFCVVGAAITTVAVSFTGLGGVTPLTSTVGASGGVLGVLMAFGLLHGDNEIWLFPIPFSIRAKYFVAGIAFITLIEAINASGAHHGENVAYVAHLGGLLFGFIYVKFLPRRGLAIGTSEKYFSLRNSYYRWKRRRAARKFEVYMRDQNKTVTFDEHGNFVPPEESDKKNGGGKSGWVN